MPDSAFINRCLGDLDGYLYSPPTADTGFGALYANDGLALLVYLHDEHLRLVAPVVFCDELESEDFDTEVTDDTEFYLQEAARFSYFLEANRCAGASRGLSVSLHRELDAVALNCKAFYSVLTAGRLHGLIKALFRVALALRVELYPDEVDPELAQGVPEAELPAGERQPGAERGPAPWLQV